MKKQGIFITFEGGDGSGKSTQIRRLKEALEKEGLDVLLCREPGSTRIGEDIRQILLDPRNREMEPMTECLLYAAARAQLVAQVIGPAVREGRAVICDRFLDSSIAYQAYGRGLGDAVGIINGYGINGCMPDLTIYLRTAPEVGRSRIAGREKDRIEAEPRDFHDKVFRGYEELSGREPERIFTIDAGRGIDEIHEEILDEVMRRFSRKDP